MVSQFYLETAQTVIGKSPLFFGLFDFTERYPPSLNSKYAYEDCTFASLRITMSKVITGITMSDAVMEKLANDATIINKFKQWMTLGIDTPYSKVEEDIRMAGALCLGNLARSGTLGSSRQDLLYFAQ